MSLQIRVEGVKPRCIKWAMPVRRSPHARWSEQDEEWVQEMLLRFWLEDAEAETGPCSEPIALGAP